MLTEERYGIILDNLNRKGSITVTEISEILGVSESTARRDITALSIQGKLVRVFGGAVRKKVDFTEVEESVAQKKFLHVEEKKRIAKYAASLIRPNEYVYLDAGTTTGYLIDYITDKSVTFVTDGITHASRLARAGFTVLVLGGLLREKTEAIVGAHTVMSLQKIHFSKGFFGTNGITTVEGFTTPDNSEAQVKRMAFEQSIERYVLADYSKFGKVTMMTFADFDQATIITDREQKGEFSDAKNIIVAP
ncbi:MAG: DeoR/GlpR family DNA-binding transcription regulator [Dorea sp.]|nr:DeoR/GlpR family DNA-binding transcription regulator [Dorea sp.]